ncbi:cobalt-precorrin-6A reductase [Pelagibacterium xiamenense]|uniref:cobalt-precorrin-6A reductase n=1 Tax=Pelagibacterium xiamenense TaxID=2901140 RepID=UPI001E5A5F91|nr:cobalt-precorrin-6A reductase [Pelagibacterium xiamenense]MCD7058829.1 cobalt-precorrin-6A reductase [Pelagibacterium xiamenense]
MTKGNDMTAPKRILILGGTAEARALADRLAGRAEDVITSLAGRTSAPSLPVGKVRTGGFGGAEGLARYLAETAVTHLVDATHPFAARISANAVIAARAANVRLLRLERPAWTPPADANWIDVPDMPAAARNIPENARVLLTIGRQELAAFHGVSDCTIFARVIEPPETVPTGWTIIAARGPFTIDQERALLETHAITHLVTKNSGSPHMAAKLEAAHAHGVAVLMIARPRLPEAETAATIEDTLSWLSA